jgi:integrase
MPYNAPNCHRRDFHDLRHSAASILLAMGASLHEVKEALGHSRIATTSDVYAHLLDSVRQETAARMDRAFGTG